MILRAAAKSPLENNTLVLGYQEAQVEKLLERIFIAHRYRPEGLGHGLA